MTGIVEVSSNLPNKNAPAVWPGIVSRFQLVILAAHRSKQLLRGAQPRIAADRLKRRNTSIALEELKRGLILFKPLAEGAPSVAGDHDERHLLGAPSALFQRTEVMETRSGTEDQQGRLELVAGARSANARSVSETGWSS